MRTSIIDLAGGTFVVTAISYATGIGYYNSLFRSMNGKSDLFSVPLERIMFEGGRQLAYITFYPALWIIFAVLLGSLTHVILKSYGANWMAQSISWLKGLELVKILSHFNALIVFLATVSFASYAFFTAGQAGAEHMKTADCLPGQITTEKGQLQGCILYKTDTEIWLTIKEDGKSILLNIPSDKYLTMKIF